MSRLARVDYEGAGSPAEKVARWADTIPYALLCGRTRFLEARAG